MFEGVGNRGNEIRAKDVTTAEKQQLARNAAAALTKFVRAAEGRRLSTARLRRLAIEQGLPLPHTLELSDLAHILDRHAPELTVVGQVEGDLVWGVEMDEDAPDVDANALHPTGEWPSGEDVEWLSSHFSNYRSLRNTSIELETLTVLVGRNGAGKSNVLDGLFRASLLTRRKPSVVFSGRHAPARVTTVTSA
jgi:hypothetical protein